MSKKKKKFNKLKKKHLIKPNQNHNQQASRITTEQKDKSLEAEIDSLPSESEDDIEESVSGDIPTSIENQYAYVKKDIKRILLIILLLVIILIAIYVMNAKTTLLSSFGDWIYQVLNITTG